MAFPQSNGQADIGTADFARADIVDKMLTVSTSAYTSAGNLATQAGRVLVAPTQSYISDTSTNIGNRWDHRIMAGWSNTALADSAMADYAQADIAVNTSSGVGVYGVETPLVVNRLFYPSLASITTLPIDSQVLRQAIAPADSGSYVSNSFADMLVHRIEVVACTPAGADYAIADESLIQAGELYTCSNTSSTASVVPDPSQTSSGSIVDTSSNSTDYTLI